MRSGTHLDTELGRAGALLEVLPDLVALAAERGLPVVVDDPGTEHGRALLTTLGVEVHELECDLDEDCSCR